MRFLKKQVFMICCVGLLSQQIFAAAQPEILAGGDAIGISLQADGVYVDSFSLDPDSPARQAGIRIGDRIVEIDGQDVSTAQSISALINAANGNPVTLDVERNGQTQQFTVRPTGDDGTWKLGLRVKDRISGIGTLTYVDPASKRFGALGHAIKGGASDSAAIRDGVVMQVSIVTVNKGTPGDPGALVGSYADEQTIGTIDRNKPQGVFGYLEELPSEQRLYPVASSDELHRGSATIRCTVDEGGTQEYAIEILSVRTKDANDRNLRFKVVDPRLLEKTGGIVQGISGAPILQDGKLIGAVTHVLVDDPEQGYGIYIGTMLEADQAILPQAA